jgi:hypothetical protein
MSGMRDDDPIRNQPPATGSVTHLADLVGRGVAYEQSPGDARHGTIVSANYSLGGETVVVVHPDSHHGEMWADTVLFGRPAKRALEHLDAGERSIADATSVDQAARRRLSAEQARTIPHAGTSAATAPPTGGEALAHLTPRRQISRLPWPPAPWMMSTRTGGLAFCG